jgi:hypothetical protein
MLELDGNPLGCWGVYAVFVHVWTKKPRRDANRALNFEFCMALPDQGRLAVQTLTRFLFTAVNIQFSFWIFMAAE